MKLNIKISSLHLNGVLSINMLVFKNRSFLKGVKKGPDTWLKDCKHAKNEIVYACKGRESILQKVANGVVGEK